MSSTNVLFVLFFTWIQNLHLFFQCYTRSYYNSSCLTKSASPQPFQHKLYQLLNFVYISNCCTNLVSNLLPSSHSNDDGDSKGEIAPSGKMLYIGSLTYLSNFFYMSQYLARTSSKCIFLFKFLHFLSLSNSLPFFLCYFLQSFKCTPFTNVTTHCKHKSWMSFQKPLNAKKLDDHSLFSFFILG